MQPRRQLPLHVLPAFDAVSRHGGLTAAGQELHLTPSAVSHQIKLLEAALGVKLFHRTSRGLSLTAEGEQYRRTVRDVLDRLDREANAIGRESSERTLRISMPDYFAERHFLPGLREFRDARPDLRVEISVGVELADIEGGTTDAAIRMGNGAWGDLHGHKLADIWATAVAAPDLAMRARELSQRGVLPSVYLDPIKESTLDLLASAGFPVALRHAVAVNSYSCLVRAVREGLGVALIMHTSQVRLRTTKNTVPLGEPFPMPFSMYFVCRKADVDLPHFSALRSWLIDLSAGRRAVCRS